jgi:hypothetical protein
MNNDEVFAELQEILKEFEVEIKYGRGYFEGGLCRYDNGQFIYLNRGKDLENHIALIISELKNFDLQGIKLSTELANLLRESEQN